MFAKYLKKLKKDQWHNSFDDLPDKNNLPPENTLLLWYLDEGFTHTFYAGNASPKSGSKTNSPNKRSNVRKNLNQDFES